VSVVNTLSGFSRMQYAVIETRRNERFVIAYRDERSLREFIAAPCIVASGFASRDAAMAEVAGQVASTAA
jgi:hypothetical protein